MKSPIVLLALLLAGCAAKPAAPEIQVRTVTQRVQVPVPCDPPVPARPASAVSALPLTADIDEQMRALRADRKRTIPYMGQLESALAACRKR